MCEPKQPLYFRAFGYSSWSSCFICSSFEIHQNVYFSSVWNSPTRSQFIWQAIRNPPGCSISFCMEFTYAFVIHLAESSESTRMLHFLLFGIHLHVRNSFGWIFGIHQDASFPSARNPTTCSSFIRLSLWNPPGCFIFFCSELTYMFVIHLAYYLEFSRMLHLFLFEIDLHVLHSFGLLSGIHCDVCSTITLTG